MKKLILAICIGCLFQPFFTKSQVLINEVSSANNGNFTDDFADNANWIELYNAGSSDVSLLNYGLSDNGSSLRKWIFPDVSIHAGGYLLILPTDTSIKNVVDHWETVINASTTWKYFVGTSNPDTNWRNISFNDASWASGPGGFGYGDGDDRTTIPSTRSVMFRKQFTLTDTSSISVAIFNMDYDDGFVAYLNGKEIARKNMGSPGDRPNNTVLAYTNHEALLYQGLTPDSFFFDKAQLAKFLRIGTNVLAVQVHNQDLTSSDLTSNAWLSFGVSNNFFSWSAVPSWFHTPPGTFLHANFKLSKSGQTLYLTNASSVIIDQKAIPNLEMNDSYGRSPNGSTTFCFFSTTTPGTSNNSSTCYTGYCSAPVFSLSGGFYSTTQTVTLSTTQSGGIIRYTLDGGVPTASSAQYSGPISISINRVVRARVFAGGTLLPGATVTNTYFINETVKLPVYSITMNPTDLYDYNTGIYVMGPGAGSTFPYFGANFWQDWPRTANVEYFNKQKVRDFKFQTEISINGGYSRGHAQKSFEINMNDKFGTSSITYVLMPDKNYITKWDDWILRNAGSDWLNVHYRDVLFEHTMKNTNASYLAAEPCVMYMNGEFFGVYWQTENDDQHFVKNNFGIKKEQIDLLKESGELETRQGTDTGFMAMYKYATTTSPTNANFYATMDSKFDLLNLADYFIVETYMNNSDWVGLWTNNIKLWRPVRPTIGKWRYITYDLDQCMGLNSPYTDNTLHTARFPTIANFQSPIFNALCQNPTFKSYFINRYADLMNTNFLPAKMISYAYALRDSISADMSKEFAKYGSSSSTWASNISSMVNSINQRPPYARNFVQSEFGMAGQVTLTLRVSPAGAGHIIINTITPETLPWNGVYFNGNPVTITAIPAPGYSFNYWHSNVAITSNNTNQSVTYNFTGNDAVTAYFTGSAAPAQITFSEINYKSASSADAGDWVELKNYGTATVDISGWYFSDGDDSHKFKFPVGTKILPGAYLALYEDATKFPVVFPTVSNKMGPHNFGFDAAGEPLRLFKWDNSLYISCTYSNASPWPTTPNGGGYTLELTNPAGNLNDGTNWFAGCPGGSPGGPFINTCCPLIPLITAGGPVTFCTGGDVLLTATSGTGYTYQWFLNGIIIPGETSQTYTANATGNYTVKISDGSCTKTSPAVSVTVNTLTPATITPSGAITICTGADILLTANSGSGLGYQWQLDGLDISGEISSTYTANAAGSYTVEVTNSCGTITSSPVVVTVTSQPTAVITPDGSLVFCPGGSVILNANTGSGLSYQWYRNGGNIGGAISASYNATVSGSYTVVVTASCGNSTSPAVVVDAEPSSATITANGPTTFCTGGSVVLTASSGTGYSYAWLNNGIPIPGALSQSYTATASGDYVVNITKDSCSATSAITVVTVGVATTATISAPTTNICNGSSVLLTASPSGSGYTYRWKRNNSNISGANHQTYNASPSSTGTYTVVVTSSCGSVTSPGLTITVNSVPSASISASGSTTFCHGSSVTFTANYGSGYTYQWQKNSVNISGATSRTYRATSTGSYRVIVTNSAGCSRTSSSRQVNVNCREAFVVAEEDPATMIQVYPNPTGTHFTINLASEDVDTKMQVLVFDITGKSVLVIYNASPNETLTIGDEFISGIYIAEIIQGDRHEIFRLIKTSKE